jgi:hypothetical protein
MLIRTYYESQQKRPYRIKKVHVEKQASSKEV